MSLFSKDPLKQGEIEDLMNDTSAAEEAQRKIDEAEELQAQALQKLAKQKSDGDVTGNDDTFISPDDLSFLKSSK